MNHKEYKITGCPDWVEAVFELRQPATYQDLRKNAPISYAEPMNIDESGESTKFKIRIQDPKGWDDLIRIAQAIDATSFLVVGCEYAVDFYPKTDLARHQMPASAAFLMRGLENPQDSPSMANEMGKGTPASPYHAEQAFSRGETCYFANKSGTHAQRIYIKQTDDNKQPIPDRLHRVRVENTYNNPNGIPGFMDGNLLEVIGKGDFAFRMVKEKDRTPLRRVILERQAQIGFRQMRASRRLFDPETVAASALNKAVRDALRRTLSAWGPCPPEYRNPRSNQPQPIVNKDFSLISNTYKENNHSSSPQSSPSTPPASLNRPTSACACKPHSVTPVNTSGKQIRKTEKIQRRKNRPPQTDIPSFFQRKKFNLDTQ